MAITQDIKVEDGNIFGLLGFPGFYDFHQVPPHLKEGYISDKWNLPHDFLDKIDIENLLNSAKEDYFVFKYKRGASILDLDSLEREIYSNTWLKAESLPLFLKNIQFKLLVGAQSKTILTQENNPLGFFENEDLQFVAFVHKSYSKKSNNINVNIYKNDGYTETKKIDVKVFFKSISFDMYLLYGVRIKSPIQINIFSQSSDFNLSFCLRKVYSYVAKSENIKSFLNQYIESEKYNLVKKIEDRKLSIKNRKRIFFVDQKSGKKYDLGFEPTNEKELIILASKLEKEISSALDFFQIVEHTSQIGIDGLIKIKKSPHTLSEEYVTVEFEYSLSNFFKHEHPIHQTKYIICWNIGVIKNLKDLGIFFTMNKEDWRFSLNFSDHIIDVLPLSKLPGLVLG
ncbi:hypothetical protein [Sodalinema gerasimenkoae]|uniref:hypothetical protein n=1 Tax=Sodalinema gerasimenkoae TaxID=2862348 RepID=UPI001359D828|nr:hypothetical protein [Sodalinema gerasimenkoae]